MLPFDTATILNLGEIQILKKSIKPENYRKNGVVLLKKLFRPHNRLRSPFEICDYFHVPYNLQRDGEHIWEIVEDIKIQIFSELGQLIDGEYEYFCDFDEVGSFALFMRPHE